MIDPNKPLELSNGTPVRLISFENDCFLVRIPAGKSHKKNGLGAEWPARFYYDKDGFFMAFEHDPNFFTLCNKENLL